MDLHAFDDDSNTRVSAATEARSALTTAFATVNALNQDARFPIV